MVVSLVLIIFVLALLVWLISANFSSRRELTGHAAGIGMLAKQLEALKTSHDDTKDKLQKSLLDGQTNVTRSMEASREVLGQLNIKIGGLQKLGNQVARLHDILSSPKMRGQMGEWSLENLLAKILPQEAYKLQYSFKDGQKVDALVQLADFSVPIDAKFPLPAFEQVTAAQTDEDRGRLRKQFRRDVMSHVDKIASSYIRPAEETLDFAMMYIPAENIYYETIIKYAGETQDILQYCLDKKVIPVSPNLLYAYLMTVVMGLHGLQIEKQAAEIRQNLKKLNASFGDFGGSWEILGKHLRNAFSQYDEGQKKLTRFGLQLDQIQADTEEKKQLTEDTD
ncbi:MAG: DNA recombination protein RmuC [Planctomycetota bacterium]